MHVTYVHFSPLYRAHPILAVNPQLRGTKESQADEIKRLKSDIVQLKQVWYASQCVIKDRPCAELIDPLVMCAACHFPPSHASTFLTCMVHLAPSDVPTSDDFLRDSMRRKHAFICIVRVLAGVDVVHKLVFVCERYRPLAWSQCCAPSVYLHRFLHAVVT